MGKDQRGKDRRGKYIAPKRDSGKITVSVLLYLAKTFDSIDCSILLTKLECYGFRSHAVMFHKSYFSGRLQYTNISDSKLL